MIQTVQRWWKEDVYRRGLLIGGFCYAWIFSQGVPLWDDDFTSWFWKIKDKSLFSIFFEWISPISTQPQFWGFNERPLQALVFKIGYLLSGYESWSYFLYKSAVFAGLGVMIYTWALRLVPKSTAGLRAAVAASIFFLLAPNPMAAHVLHQDFAPTAELLFLMITYFMWGEIEKTPESWSGMPKFNTPETKSWLKRWTVLSVVTYLGYKSKADLKLIPIILALYIFAVRRKQIAWFAVPVAFMLLLAVPWGHGIFTKLPPFVPGSKGSEIGWMWQPASFARFREFIWASGSYDFIGSLRGSTISLSGLLGPFLLVGLLIFLAWKMEAFDKVKWTTQATSADRSRTFVLTWFVVILLGTSALPEINYIFRIRYGILPLVPASILLAWTFGLFADSLQRLPKWAVASAMALFVVQVGINLNRSIVYRHDMGQVMVAVDQAYDYVNHKFPNEKLVLLPDFRPYDYRPDAGQTFATKEWVSSNEDIAKKYQPFKTYAISWKPSLWEQFEMVENFPGCRETTIFDRIFTCEKGSGTYLMRYIGQDPLYAQGEALRAKGDIAGAMKIHEQFLAKYPQSMAGQFVLGLEAFQQKDWARSELAYSQLERYFPDHLAILYNHALALAELKQYRPAQERLKFIANKEPSNYAALINLYWAYQKDGNEKTAKQVLISMKRAFPTDGDVNRLIASH